MVEPKKQEVLVTLPAEIGSTINTNGVHIVSLNPTNQNYEINCLPNV
jgi:hypothetical protein